MSADLPAPDSDDTGARGLSEESRNTRSFLPFLSHPSAKVIIGCGLVGLLVISIWQARRPLVATSLSGLLRSQGIGSVFTVEKLQLGTTVLRNIRLGPSSAPDLVVDRAQVTWRVDPRSRLILIEHLQLDGVQGRLTIRKDGALDFGSLAPLLKPSKGPKRTSINGLSLNDARIVIHTPMGQSLVRLRASGGERDGFVARADVSLPAGLIPIAKDVPAVTRKPVRIGVAAITQAGAKPVTHVGFALHPDGQNLQFQGTQIWGLNGAILGQVRLSEGGLSLTTRASTLVADKIESAEARAGKTMVLLDPLSWQQGQNWQSTGFGRLSLSARADGPQLAAVKITSQQLNLKIGVERDRAGQMALGYAASAFGIEGGVTGQSFITRGRLDARLSDLTQWSRTRFTGTNQTEAFGFVLPAGLAQGIGGAAKSRVNVRAPFVIAGDMQAVQVRLASKALVIGAGDTTASVDNPTDGRPLLALSFREERPKAKGQLNVAGSGRLSVTLPGRLKLQANLDAFSFRPPLWAARIRDVAAVQTLRLNGGAPVTATALVDVLDLEQAADHTILGRGSARLDVVGGNSRAMLAGAFDLDSDTISAKLSGPIEGFGAALGVKGYGVAGGSLDLSAQAQSQGAGNWVFSSQGRVGVNGVNGSQLRMAKAALNLSANGATQSLSPTRTHLNATVALTGDAGQVTGGRAAGAAAISGLALGGQAQISGELADLRVRGSLSAKSADGTIGTAALKQGDASIEFGGQLTPTKWSLTGQHRLKFGHLSQLGSEPNGRVDIERLTADGPFAFDSLNSSAPSAQNAGFWAGALTMLDADTAKSFRSELDLTMTEFQIGATKLSGIALRTPVRITNVQGRPLAWQARSNLATKVDRLTSGETQLKGLTLDGQMLLDLNGAGNIAVHAPQCLRLTAIGGALPGDMDLGPVAGQICPNKAGQLAILGATRPQVFATTTLDPLTLRFGEAARGQSIKIGAVTGGFSSKANGNVNLAMKASEFGLTFALGEGQSGQVTAQEASLDIEPGPKGVALRGQLGALASPGLPIALTGGANTDLLIGPDGMSGFFQFDDVRIADVERSPRFGAVKLSGGGTLANNQLTILGDIFEPGSGFKIGEMVFSHDVSKGAGDMNINAADVILSPTPLQNRAGLDIVTLLPTLRGVVSDMVGAVSGKVTFAWAPDKDLASTAQLVSKGLDFATLLGPVTGMAGDIQLDDVLLARTKGTQIIKIGSLNTGGIPILDGIVQFTLPGNNSLRLEDASWPFADGRLSVRPATWTFRDGDQGFAIDVEDVDLAKLLRLTEIPNLLIDGKVSGVFPIEVRQGNVEIVGGRLKARDGGGLIRYTGPNLAPPPPPPGFWGRLRQRLFGKAPPSGADLAVQALRALEYKILEITVDGRLSGELQLGVILEGANQQVLSGQPFKFTIKMNVPLGQLIDNINRFNNTATSPEVLEELDRILKSEETKPDTGLVRPSPQ